MLGAMKDVRCFIFLAGAAALAGCGGSADGNDVRAAANEAAGTSFKEQPVKEEHRSLALTPQWLAGRWQTDQGDCSATDAILTFQPDGRYSFTQEGGRWSLEGNNLTIEVTDPAPDGGGKAGDRNTVQVTPVGPNEADFRFDEGQAPQRVFRCHDGSGDGGG